jgi:outer membrane receptor protein involved in Fe transport
LTVRPFGPDGVELPSTSGLIMQRQFCPARASWRVAVLLGLSGVSPLAAQQPARDTTAVELETITVTAPGPRSTPPVELSVDVPARLVERQHSSNAYDLIRRAAGIEVHEQGQGPGWASDVVIRGFTSDHSSDVLLVLDGVPINLPIHGHVEGYSDWTILSPAAIQSIRVIHGPASPLYGNFAVGGAVEVNAAHDATGLASSLGGSSYGDASGWLRGGARHESSGYLFGVQGERGQGWRDNSSSGLGNLQLRGWKRLDPRTRIEGGLTGYGSGWDSPGFLSVADYNAGHLTRAADPTDGGSSGRGILHGRIARTLASGGSIDLLTWVQVARSTVFLTVPDDGAAEQQEERDRRSAVGFSGYWRVPTSAGESWAGIGGRADWDTYDLYQTERRERLLATQRTDGRYQEVNAYLRTRGLAWSHLQYDLSLRGDILRYASRDRLAADSRLGDNISAVLSPKLGARYLLGGGWSAVASINRGFRGPVGVIADVRQPLVTAWAKEIGIELAGNRVSGQFSAFQTDVQNEKILDPVTLQITDAGSSRRRGFSGQLGVQLTSRLRVSAEGTFNDAKITGGSRAAAAALLRPSVAADSAIGFPTPPLAYHVEPLSPGSHIPGVSRYLGRVEAEYRVSERLSPRVTVRFAGPFTPIGEDDVRTSAYVVADLGASIGLAPRAVLDVELQNLLDTKYPEIRASGFLNPGTPRTLRAAVRYSPAAL